MKDNKDWVGNKNSMFKTLGASNHTDYDREVNDFYATDPNALIIFLDKLKRDNVLLSNNVWECACGQGHLSEVLKKYGYNVYSSDLVDRGYTDCSIEDFLKCDKKPFNETTILTNPPYKYAEEFVRKSLELINDNEKVCMFLKIQFLEGQSRYKLFKEYPPKYVYVNSSRQVCAMNGEFIKNGKKESSAVCYCWFVWEKSFKGEPIIRWL